jgi:hypothetical protein
VLVSEGEPGAFEQSPHLGRPGAHFFVVSPGHTHHHELSDAFSDSRDSPNEADPATNICR